MFLDQAPLSAHEVLLVFHREEPALFLGAAFNTVALICLGFCLVRRRFNTLLVWLGLFASLYGTRMWLESDIVRLSLAPTEIFHRIRVAINFLVPIPAFFFFQATGLLPRRESLSPVFLRSFSPAWLS